MAETLIRIVEDVVLEDGCTHTWRYSPLGESGGDGAMPCYRCDKHQVNVPLQGPCPRSEFWARKGETVSVPTQIARRLVESELAEYPTHSPEPDQGVDATVSRVNALLEAQGLPLTDLEAMGVLAVQGRQTPYQRPTKPTHRRLADDLGMDTDDFTEMRKLAGGG